MKITKGFTIIELLAMMVILIATVTLFINWIQMKSILHSAKIYADQSKAYADIYIRYLNQNKENIESAVTPNTPMVITFKDIQNQGYLPTGVQQKNLFSQTPCLIVTKNHGSNTLSPIMFFVDGSQVQQEVGSRAMVLIGGMAGIYNNFKDNVIGNLGQWGYDRFISNNGSLIRKCGNTIANNSIFLNISMMNTFNDILTPDVTLHRLADKYNKRLGDSNNTNTLVTDISFAQNGSQQSKKLYFFGKSESEIYLQASDLNNHNVRLYEGAFLADYLQPTQKFAPGKSCLPTEVGAVSSVEDNSYGFQGSILVCTYNPPVCQSQSQNDYCYISVKHNTIKFTNKGQMGQSFLCPAGAPVAVDAVVNNLAINIQYRTCAMSMPQARQFDCNKGNISNTSRDLDGTAKGEFITYPININGSIFKMQIGYKATGVYPDLKNCDTNCRYLGMSRDIYKYPEILNANCPCISGDIKDPIIADVLSVTPTKTSSIQYVTCTSKMVISQ